MKKHPVLGRLLVDLALAGAALLIFALFHHVLPRPQESLGIVIPRPSGEVIRTVDADEVSPDAMLLASTGVSDAPLMAKGSGKNSRGSGSSEKGGSALTESTGASGTAAEEDLPMAEKFSGRFTDTVEITDTGYTSPDVSIQVERKTLGDVTCYVADIYLRDVTCLQAALAQDSYGSGFRDSIQDMAVLHNALLAVNGDYYGNTREGVVIRNGVIYRANPTDCDVCVLYYDGTMRVMPGSSFSLEEAIEDGAWQAWTFGPALLDSDGNAIDTFNSTRRIISANPRTAIGYYEPGHYCMVVVDGRGESSGMTLQQLSAFFADLGCTAAYNLDGGNSSIMVWQDAVLNNPSGGGRESSDALLIREVTADD